jgi:hypothetical protein
MVKLRLQSYPIYFALHAKAKKRLSARSLKELFCVARSNYFSDFSERISAS